MSYGALFMFALVATVILIACGVRSQLLAAVLALCAIALLVTGGQAHAMVTPPRIEVSR